MALRILIHIPRRLLAALLLVLLAAILVFFAATRTQVGRDQVRQEVERQFDDAFSGNLSIGQLTGNLAQTFYARDVAVRAPDGRVVLSVDSVIVRPRWRDLFRRTVSAGSITLIRPTLRLVRRPDGTWNAADAFERAAAEADTTASPWSFTSADVRIVDGRVITHNLGSPPKAVDEGLLFNYADAEATDVHARAIIELGPTLKLVDLLSFTAVLPGQATTVDALRAQLTLEDDALAVTGLALHTEGTSLEAMLQLDGMAALADGRVDDVALDLDLDPSRLDLDALRRLLPSLPLADAVTVEGRIRGPLAGLVIENVDVRRGRSRLQAEGTLLGLPDVLDFELAFQQGRLTRADLGALLRAPLPPEFTALLPIDLDLYTRGTFTLTSPARPGALQARMALTTAAGTLEGEATLDRLSEDALRYRADVQGSGIDPGLLLGDAGFAGDLNGRLVLEGTGGLHLQRATTDLTLNLGASRLAGRRLDTLQARFALDEGTLEGNAFALEGNARLDARGRLDLRPGRRPVYRLEADARRLDLGRILQHNTLATRLDARLAMDGSGTTLRDLQGSISIDIDSSTVRWDDTLRTIPPNRLSLTLAQLGAESPRFVLEGDLGRAAITGDVALAPLPALARLWRETLADAGRALISKPYGAAGDSLGIAYAGADSATVAAWRAAARRDLADAGLEGQQFTVEAVIYRPDILSALLPMTPPLESAARTTLTVRADPDELRLDGTLTDAFLRVGGLAADSLTLGLHALADLDAPQEERLTAEVNIRGDTLWLGGLLLSTPAALLTLEGPQGHLAVTTGSTPAVGPLRLDARLDLLPDRNRLTLTRLHLETGGYAWTAPEAGTIDLYGDAVVFPGLVLTYDDPIEGAAAQRLRLEGTLSAAPRDTATVYLERIQLRPLSGMAGLQHTVGGRVDGHLAFTGLRRQPQLTGALTVHHLSLDDHLLGRLDVTSSYRPGLPDVALHATLAPAPSDAALQVLPGTTIAARHTENRLDLDGTLRLPGGDDGGLLDLDVAVTRADLFFFRYILPDLANIEGFAVVDGTITGSFTDPTFEADARIEQARFDVPEFGLSYTAEGPVRVDRAGIHVDDAVVRDKTGGTATIAGSLNFNDYRFFSLDVRGLLQDIQIIDVRNSQSLPFYGAIWASGTATLTGPLYNATLRSTDAVTHPDSEIFIPVTESASASDAAFIVFADSTGRLPDLSARARRRNVLDDRPEGERAFLDGLEMDLNLFAPQGSTVHLVIDPLLGDVINAVGSGRIQLQLRGGEFFTYGSLAVSSGDYLFTAGEVFFRRFLIDQGRLTWDGDPLNAELDIDAAYRTRASTAGLNLNRDNALLPVVIRMHVTGRVETPVVDLGLGIDRDERSFVGNYEGLEAELNQSERTAQYATSVLLTNSFLLTINNTETRLTDSGNQLAFNSLSQLVASQLNRYIGQALPNLDLNFGFQGESTQDLDVTYGVALRLLDERLIIRGQGVYLNDPAQRAQQNLLDEFVVEVRLNQAVSVEVFYRQEGDLLSQPQTSTTGAGLSYQTQFATWRRLLDRLFGWITPSRDDETTDDTPTDPVAGT